MPDREYWTRELEDAKRELEAATKRSEVDAAAKRLQRAKSGTEGARSSAETIYPWLALGGRFLMT
jgi:hypothetical protein